MKTRRWLPFAVLLALAAKSPEQGVNKILPLGDAVKVPTTEGKPVRLPDDLAAAGKTWGIDAQIAKLKAAAPEEKKEFSFAVIGDAEPGRFAWERLFLPNHDREIFQKLLGLSQAQKPDFIFQLGDAVSIATVENYRRHMALLDKEVSVPYFAVMGNHDRSAPNGKADKTLYKGIMGKTDYAFEHGGWRFIGLDTADRRVTSKQLAWLKGALAGPLPKMLFTHVPPAFIKGKLKSSCPATEEKAPDNEDYLKDVLTAFFPDDNKEFENLISNGNVRRVYMGHIHAYGTTEYRGVRYVLTGGGGSPLYPLPPGMPSCKFAHYVEVRVFPDAAADIIHRLDGKRFPISP